MTGATRMRFARLVSPGSLAIEEAAVPEPGVGEVLLRVEACGLCGSDRHMFKGEFPTAWPVTLGHEFSGIVEAVGEGVSRLAPGERITADPNIACLVCPQCRRGRFNLCDRLLALGVHRDGGFADFVLVPERQAHVLPRDLDPRLGAFCEPLACCLHALDVARIAPGDSVAVLGGGVIGLLMVQLARLAGAGTIVLSTRQKPRRDLAERLGATHAVDPGSGDAAAMIAGPGGICPMGVDVVLECAGVPQTVGQGMAIARRGGALVLFGVVPEGARIDIEPFALLTRELRIESAWLNPLTHGRAAAMVASGALDLPSLVSRIVPLEDIPRLVASAPAFGEVKILAMAG